MLSGKFHTQMHIFVALAFCIRFQNHRHAQPVTLGKGDIQNLAHIALPLILLPHTDKPNENVGLSFLVHAVLQGSPATLMPMPVQRMASRRGRREIRKISHVSTLPVSRSEGRMSSTPTNKEQTERIISRTPRKTVER